MKTNINIKWSLIYACAISLIFSLFASALMPSLRLNYFAALIALLILNATFSFSLWLIFAASLIIDLFSSTILGFHSLIGVLSIGALFTLKRFFHNTTVNLFLLTVISSFFMSILQIFFFFLFEKSFKITFSFLAVDFFLMAFLDGLYALAVFTLPFYLLDLAKQKFRKIQAIRKAKKQESENPEEEVNEKTSSKEETTETVKEIIEEES